MMQPYYEQDGIVIYHGDCREVSSTLGQVDHVITDPPYSDVTHAGARGGCGDSVLVDFASVTDSEIRFYLGLTIARRWLVATVDWRHVRELEQRPPKGYRFVRFGVWVKPNGAPQFTGDRPATGWEAVAIMHSDTGRMRWNGGGHHAVFTHMKVNGLHPTTKPDALLFDFVHQFTDVGETILDPFIGIGTTLTAAKRLGRKAIGIELEEKYCEIAAKSLAQGYVFNQLTEPIQSGLMLKESESA
jgi:site-specific DNA-methyltransferase (adenine-specific)